MQMNLKSSLARTRSLGLANEPVGHSCIGRGLECGRRAREGMGMTGRANTDVGRMNAGTGGANTDAGCTDASEPGDMDE